MAANTPSDRVQLRSQGELALPGSCALCGSGNCEDGYLDFDLWFEFYGRFYLCVTCFKQGADVADFLHPDEAAHIHETNQSLAEQLTSAQEELDKKNDLLSKWDAVITAATGGTLANIATLVSASMGDAEDDGSNVEDGTGTPVGTDEGEPVAEKSVKGKGRRVVSSPTASDSSTPEPQFDL